MGVLFDCKSLNLQEYVSVLWSHLGEIKMHRFFCMTFQTKWRRIFKSVALNNDHIDN